MKNIIHSNKKNLEEALMAFRHAMTSALVEEAKRQGWSLSQFEVIKHIAELGNPSMKDIAAQLHITPPSASSLVDTLVEKNLVIRNQAPDDRRTVHVTLSPHAQKILSSIYKQKSSIFNTMFSKLESKDQNELARILIKCISI